MNTFKFSSFTVEPHNFRLLNDCGVIEIEPQVFETLLLLVQNRKRVITSSELLEKIWQGRVVSNQVITRVIYELRKILDNKIADKTSHIRTVRGKGYQFIVDVEVIDFQENKNITSYFTMDKIVLSPWLKYKWLIGFMILSVIGVVLIKQYYGQSNLSTTISSNLYPEYLTMDSLLIIKTGTSNNELSMLTQSLTDTLTNQLAVNLNIKIKHPTGLVNLSDQFDDSWSAQKGTRSDFLIQGFIEPVRDQSINLHLNLYKSDFEEKLKPFSLNKLEFSLPQNLKELNDLNKQWHVIIRSIIEINKPKSTDRIDHETNDFETFELFTAEHL